MSLLLRGLLAAVTAGALTFPTNPPKLASSHEGGRRRAAAPTLPKAPTHLDFASNQLEYYLNDDGIAYIRPGYKIKVNSVTIGSDRKPVVDVNFTDSYDQPLDRNGKITPGALSASMILAWYNPATRYYTAYTTRSVTTPANSPHPGVTAIQAGTDSGGTWKDLEMGHATYTFKTALPAGYDATKTHTLAVYGARNLTDQIGKQYYSNVEYDFRPDGGAVTDTWAKINQATSCNNCHDPLSAHGGSRQDVKLCAVCHQPQTIDPDTGNTVDMKVMAHKIHFGPNLPSVKAGTPYVIVGNAQNAHDYSNITFPQDIRNCDNCHEGTDPTKKPAQATVYLTNPSIEACGSCHDDVNFATGANHPAGAYPDSTKCATCHIPDSGAEFDASIKGAHTIPVKSKQLKGITATIVSVTDLAPGKKPTVTFALKNGDGTAIDGSKLNSFSPMIAGPTVSYSKFFRESAVGKATFDATSGTSTYTFTNAVPADATGSWVVSADAYRNVTLKRADQKADIAVREAAMNPVNYYSLDPTKPVVPRRVAVDLNKCNSCHDRLALHGGQRLTTLECVICHNPTESDKSRRPAGDDPESISFQRMIHRIHTGEELTQEYTVASTNFNEVTFPGDRRNCTKCHVNNTQNLPPALGAAPVDTPRDYFSPQGPGTAACLGCHDNQDAAAHAALNTTSFRGLPAEACATCHGLNKDWAVDKVHAR